MLRLVCLAPEAWSWGDPSPQQETWLPSYARPMWKLHLSVQAAEAAGECDEAAEMGSRPGGRGAPTPGRAACATASQKPGLVLPTETG